VAALQLAVVSGALAAGRSAGSNDQDAAGLARSVELLAGLGGRAAVAVGALLFALTALDAGSGPTTWLVLGIGAGAVLFGAVLIRTPLTIPVLFMDAVAVGADGALVLLAHLDSYVVAAMPGIYLVMGTITIAVRRWQVAVTHAVLLAASYAGVLIVSGADHFAPAKWIIQISCIVGAGLFVRWLVASVTALAASERAARDLAVQARSGLERVGAAKSKFLAHMSHELRTPLNVVLGYADLLAERRAGPLNEHQSAYLDDIRTSARHLVDLVDEVFDLAQADTGGVHLSPGPVDIGDLLADALSLIRGTLTDRNVRAVLTVPAGLPFIEADRLKIRQVVVNLLGNAAKFTPPGGRIVLRAHTTEEAVIVQVTDTGIGIPEEDRERIFEEYAQSAGSVGGTGLGLPLARRLVEMHGGTLRLVESSPNGSTFSFALPIKRPVEFGELDGPPRSESPVDRFAAFGEPGSPANRRLLSQIGCVFAINGSVVTAAVAMIAPPSRTLGFIALGAAVLTCIAALVAWRRVARHQVQHVASYLWAVTAMTTGITYVGGPYAPLLPLTYGFVTIVGFTFLPRRRALAHLVGIAACYGGILLIRQPAHAMESWLSVLALLAFDGGIVSWMNRQLRALAVAEHSARAVAEGVCAELAATSRHKGAFVANMSHELRTPLNAVIGFAELLDTDVAGPLTEQQRQYLDEVQTAARHLLSIINEVLDMAKLDAGQLQISPELTAVRPLIDGAIAKATAGPARRLTVQARIDPGIDFVLADPVRIEEAITHLVSNAVRFTPDGGQVTVSVRRAGADEVHIAVADTGVGIAPDHRESVFDAFSPGRAVAGQTPVGTGTGLALARGLVEVHGGRLWLTSRTGKGSTFTIALPQQAAAEQTLAGSAT
jgi:signal transduction histidine kinase